MQPEPLPSASFAARLHDTLDAIRSDFQSVLERSAIRNVDPNRGSSEMVFFGFADWDWAPDDTLIGDRTRLLATLNEWADLLMLLHRDAVQSTLDRIGEQLELLRGWLTRDGSDHTVPSTIADAAVKADQAFAALDELIRIGVHGAAELIVVPDTNALLNEPDVTAFQTAVGSSAYTVVMLTTVLSELDELKDRGRTEDVRARATAAIRRLKGLRDRGDLRVGVPVQGKIRLRMEHREVEPRSILNWLDPATPDDRILAGTLDLQARSPIAHVVLVTGDINLQNKAAAVGLPFADPSP